MKKLIYVVSILVFLACDSEEAPECFKTAGSIIREEVEVSAFTEIMVYQGIKLFIEQGPEHKIVIESGENLINAIRVEVNNGRLTLENGNYCNYFRDYDLTAIYVTVPDLEWIQSSTSFDIESVGTLTFENLWLRSLNQEKASDIYTDGDFKLDLEVENLRITSDHLANFHLTGTVQNCDIFFAAGDGRLEARDLLVQNYDIFHRGTNKIIVNPRQSLKGDIYSYGDIISVHKPPVVEVTEHFKGKLIFEAP